MAIPGMAFKLPNLAESAAALRWARRLLLLQGRLRSNEPTQILVCASFGALVGWLVAGLHELIDWIHHVAFHISGDHSLSSGIGVDPDRILIVPAEHPPLRLPLCRRICRAGRDPRSPVRSPW